MGADEADGAGALAPRRRPGSARTRCEIIGFDRTARRLTPVQLAEVEPEWVQGTNLQHALMLAARHLRRHPDAEPVVLVVTDGEPTAHIAPTARRCSTGRPPTRRCARPSARSTS